MNELVLTIEGILKWFYSFGIDYPFRNNRNPYRVWVSETLLQQTRLDAAVGKIENFLNRFPSLEKLANADESEVLYAFKGLGYYNRARNLHKGARFMLNTYSGVPESYGELLEVPSIGPYTAAAISSICFKRKILSIDGNIRRVFARIMRMDNTSPAFDAKLRSLVESVYGDLEYHPGDLNESLMQFGQMVCKAKKPLCTACPVSSFCLALSMNMVKQYPALAQNAEKFTVNWKILIIVFENQILLNKYQNFQFLKQQTGFPSMLELENKELFSSKSKIVSRIFKQSKENVFLKAATHSITKYKITFHYQIIGLSRSKKSRKLEGHSQSLNNGMLMMDLEGNPVDPEMFIIDEPDLFFEKIENVSGVLISSGLSKVWNHALNSISARGGT
ncbi:MAG: hypothetical protein OEV66_09980 [Spirochaetia bacterium]|nr:hypothetical protein [Spirochaetia bacterium]